MRIKQGYPQEGEIVLCTITNIQYHSVFCKLEEYGRSGMIHISEVSPGRIRNLRDYVKEGKVVICKVLKVNEEKGHIDLSLRRVSEGQRRQKNSELKQEQKAEKIVESAARELKTDSKKLQEMVYAKLSPNHELVYPVFEAVVEHDEKLKNHGFDDKTAKALEAVIKDKIKPREVCIKGTLTMSCYAENGLEIVKKALIDAEKSAPEISITYLGGGHYNLQITAKDYKTAEKHIKNAVDLATEYLEKNKGKAEFKRAEA